MGTRTLIFPADRIVGRLYWQGSWDPERGPILATAKVDVPDDQPVTLSICPIRAVERHGHAWSMKLSSEPIDLAFLTRLPAEALRSLTLTRPLREDSLPAIVHLAPSLRRLFLSSTGLTDDALPHVAALREISYLQTSGNNFSDLRPLARLVKLEHLHLQERNLTLADLDFVDRLTNLKWLVLHGTAITDDEFASLQAHLPDISVVR